MIARIVIVLFVLGLAAGCANEDDVGDDASFERMDRDTLETVPDTLGPSDTSATGIGDQ